MNKKAMTKKMIALLVALLAATMIIGSLGVTAQNSAQLFEFGCVDTPQQANDCRSGEDTACLATAAITAQEINMEMRLCVGSGLHPWLIPLDLEALEAEAASGNGPSLQCIMPLGRADLFVLGSDIHSAAVDLSIGCPPGNFAARSPSDCIAIGGRIERCI